MLDRRAADQHHGKIGVNRKTRRHSDACLLTKLRVYQSIYLNVFHRKEPGEVRKAGFLSPFLALTRTAWAYCHEAYPDYGTAKFEQIFLYVHYTGKFHSSKSRQFLDRGGRSSVVQWHRDRGSGGSSCQR